jgi:hypothetical protein
MFNKGQTGFITQKVGHSLGRLINQPNLTRGLVVVCPRKQRNGFINVGLLRPKFEDVAVGFGAV